jgi:large subunit ribosomal protein L10
MNRDQKAAVVDEVATQIADADAVLAIDYRGLSVTQAVELRTRLGEADASFRVVKNRLTSRAADKAGADSLKEVLEGPTAFAFVKGDAALAAKELANFRREHQLLAFKGGTMDGEPITVEQIESIARLPGRDALQGQFVGVLASPLTGLVRGLGSMVQGLAVALGQIQERGLVGADAGEGEEQDDGDQPSGSEQTDDVEAAEEESRAAAAEEEAESAGEESSAEVEASDEQQTDASDEAESEEG